MVAGSYEYENWVSRKPSKKKIQRAALKADPLGTLGQLGAVAGKRALERAGETAARTGLRTAKIAGLGALGVTGTAVAAAATSGAILAAGYLVMDRVARTQQAKLGDRLNAISNRFVETQRQLQLAFHGRVPDDVNRKALADYKRALATANAQAQGSAFAGQRAEGSYK